MSKAQDAYDFLRQHISDGTYGPGFRLIVDQLTRETGISAIPWREALRRLEAQGWVENTQNVGARVPIFDREAYAQTAHVIARLAGFATAESLTRLTPEDLVEARHINDSMAGALEDFDPVRFTSLNRDFHFIFFAKSGNPRLIELIGNEWSRMDLIRRPTYSLVPGRVRESMHEHATLLELLETGDPANYAAVEDEAREHQLGTLRVTLSQSEVQGDGQADDIDEALPT